MGSANTGFEVHQGDCLDVMRGIPDGSVDACITDPPYGTTACSWDAIISLPLMWKELKRVVKPNGAILLFSSQPFSAALIMSHPEMFRCEWIWSKSNGGGFLNANRYPLKRHENILLFARELPTYNPQMTKGKPYACTSSSAGATTQDQSVAGWVTINDGSRYPTTILEYSNETGLHPTQKPVELLRYLVRTYSNEGETVLDFTCGSGTTGVACVVEGRRFIGIERDANYAEVSRARISRATGQAVDIPRAVRPEKELPLFEAVA